MATLSKASAKKVPGARRRARRYALQALFQWHFSGGTAAMIEKQFREEKDFSQVDAAFFRFLLRGVIGEAAALDDRLLPLLDRSLSDLGGVERTLLRIGAWEICCEEDLPWKVAVDQATALARIFGATGSHRYVNAVLDRFARELGLADSQKKTSGGDLPEDVPSQPEDVSSQPEDVSSQPEDVSSQPEDVSSQPEDVPSQPEDAEESPLPPLPPRPAEKAKQLAEEKNAAEKGSSSGA